MSDPEDKEKWYIKGQEDENYRPPHDRPDGNLFGTYSSDEAEDREAYGEGWEHSKSQED